MTRPFTFSLISLPSRRAACWLPQGQPKECPRSAQETKLNYLPKISLILDDYLYFYLPFFCLSS